MKKKTRNFSRIWRRTPGRIVGITLVRFYQIFFSWFIGGHCRHLPTCSEYAYEAIAHHGLWVGAWMSFFRIMRCGPFGTHGFDPVSTAKAPHYCWYRPWTFSEKSKKHSP